MIMIEAKQRGRDKAKVQHDALQICSTHPHSLNKLGGGRNIEA